VSCRTLTVPAIDSDGFAAKLGNRPMVTDTRTRRQREIDFRGDAKAKAGDSWRGMSETDRRRLIASERRAWSARAVGQVPAETDYGEWLADQPIGFQDEHLGPTRARLFRKGELELDSFTDRAGNDLTLADLAKRHPDAFIHAGMDPATFL
jgi:hypothetical protein